MLSADRIVELARAAKPGWDIALLNPPAEARNTWRVLFRPPAADPALRSRGAIWLDPRTGALVHDRTSDVMSMGDRYLTEQLWLHNGATFGLIGRLVIFVSGFAPLALFFTGFVMWRKKRVARTRVLSLPAPPESRRNIRRRPGLAETKSIDGNLPSRVHAQANSLPHHQIVRAEIQKARSRTEPGEARPAE
jgi:uncharacterized iron-regulated membrane protein